MLAVRDTAAFLADLTERRTAFYPEIEEQVRKILARVRAEGDAALFELTERFDGVDLRTLGLPVPDADQQAALGQVSPAFMEALALAARNIEAFHRPQVPNSWFQPVPTAACSVSG